MGVSLLKKICASSDTGPARLSLQSCSVSQVAGPGRYGAIGIPRPNGSYRHSQTKRRTVRTVPLAPFVCRAPAGLWPAPVGPLAEGCSESRGMGMSGQRHGALQHPGAVGTNAGGSKKGLLGNRQLHVLRSPVRVCPRLA